MEQELKKNWIRSLQYELAENGYSVGNPDGNFGLSSRIALEKFRKECNDSPLCNSGEKLSGEPGLRDLEALTKLSAPLNGRQSVLGTRESIFELQRHLNRLGHVVREDGIYDRETSLAFQSFRAYYTNEFRGRIKLNVQYPYNEKDRAAMIEVINAGKYSSDEIKYLETPLANYGSEVIPRFNRNDADVHRIQQKLRLLGYDLQSDGEYGLTTRLCVEAFVTDYNKEHEKDRSGFYGISLQGETVTAEVEVAMDDTLRARGVLLDNRTKEQKDNYQSLIVEHKERTSSWFKRFLNLFH